MKLRLLMLGKTRRPEIRAILDDYVKRISRSCPVEITEVRPLTASLEDVFVELTYRRQAELEASNA